MIKKSGLLVSLLLLFLCSYSANGPLFNLSRDVTLNQYVGTIYATESDTGQYLTFTIRSGNTNGAFALDSLTGVLTVANEDQINIQGPSLYSMVVRVTDNGVPPLYAEAIVTVTVTGGITYQRWNNINGATVSDLTKNANFPGHPASYQILTSMEAPTNAGNYYGARMIGFLIAPITGYYCFWIASDEQSELWLGATDSPLTRRRIAYSKGWTAPKQWTKYASQKSAKIYLEQGNVYYIEAIMKEHAGNDNFAVGWAKPEQSSSKPSEVIPNGVLIPIN